VNEPHRDAVPDELRARIFTDPWAQAVGIEFLDLRPGYCQAALSLQPHMVNFQGTPHGAVVFSLVDAAFSAACNSHGPAAVALNMTISYLSAARPGARLVAEARVCKQGRRAGFYDVAVTDDQGALVATAHCLSHRVGREA
jgi:acyl-CoA thioesterase